MAHSAEGAVQALSLERGLRCLLAVPLVGRRHWDEVPLVGRRHWDEVPLVGRRHLNGVPLLGQRHWGEVRKVWLCLVL